MKNKGIRIISLLCILHAMVDFICIFSLFHFYKDRAEMFLLYNFCAFALQLPCGMIADLAIQKEGNETQTPLLLLYAGVVLCIAGAYLSPLIFGLGNALFHAGGGILSIHTDRSEGYNGKGLGTFVAPGAFGVTLGILTAETSWFHVMIICTAVCMIACSYLLKREYDKAEFTGKVFTHAHKPADFTVSLSCLCAVILRSLGGMSLAFSWKKTVLLTIFMTAATALGKAAGGFVSAKVGRRRTEIFSLVSAAICYVVSSVPAFGMTAVFFFNMSMPLTLEETAENHHDMPGFAFGLLTFGLFLGYLPGYYALLRNLDAKVFGAFISLVTMGLLVYASKKAEER